MKLGTLLLIAAVTLTAGRMERQPQPSQFDAFYGGLLAGFQLNSTAGPCFGALQAAAGDTSAFVNDFLQLIQGNEKAITYFLLDGRDMLGDFRASNATCNFSALWDAISALGNTAGQQQLTYSFTVNINVFLLDFQQLALCGSNWTACGHAVGELLRMTLSWGIF